MRVEDLTVQLVFREGGSVCAFAPSSVGFVRVLSEGGRLEKSRGAHASSEIVVYIITCEICEASCHFLIFFHFLSTEFEVVFSGGRKN